MNCRFDAKLGLGHIFDNAIKECPNKDAIIFYDWHITYQEFGDWINQTSHYIKKSGIKREEHIAIISRNCPEFFITEFASYKLGVIPVKINWRLSSEELKDILIFNDVKFIFTDKENYEKVKVASEGNENIKKVIAFDGNSKEDSPLVNLILNESKEDIIEYFDENSVAGHMLTSGTTGIPKSVMYPQVSMVYQIDMMIDTYKIHEVKGFITQLFHSAATGAWRALADQKTLVLIKNFDVKSFMRTIEKYHIDTTDIIPTMLKMMLDEMNNDTYDISCLKEINYSTCPMPTSLLQAASKKIEARYCGTYGTTEMGSAALVLLPDDHYTDGGKHISSIGKPMKYVKAKILREDGSECEVNEIGEISLTGPGKMLGYYKLEELSKEKISNGYYRTGDMGYIDEDGFITLTGRKDDLIISGGENIYPMEITNVLMRLSDVVETISFGVPDDKWGEHVCTYVVLNKESKLNENNILNFCKDNISHYKCPKEIHLIDTLPKNATGKVDIQKLK